MDVFRIEIYTKFLFCFTAKFKFEFKDKIFEVSEVKSTLLRCQFLQKNFKLLMMFTWKKWA